MILLKNLTLAFSTMPKLRRPENRHLPSRWRKRHGAYYYSVPTGLENQWDGKREFRLGSTLHEAYQTWAERLRYLEQEIQTMKQVMDRYLLEVVPAKAPSTQESNQLSISRLRPVFSHMRPASIKPKDAYQYNDAASKRHGQTSARHDIQCLRHMLTKCVEWGVIERNELLGQVRLTGSKPRDRFIEDWEIVEVLTLKSSFRGLQIVQPYIRLKLMTGLRRGDILRLKLSNIKADGIHLQPNKTRNSTGKRLIIEWDDSLRTLIDDIKLIKPRRIGDSPLFTTRQGKPYIDKNGKCNAFDSLWQRFMDKVLKETKVSVRFQERDLRAKVASDSDTLEEASARLGHADTAITNRVYRRKPVRIQPLVRLYE